MNIHEVLRLLGCDPEQAEAASVMTAPVRDSFRAGSWARKTLEEYDVTMNFRMIPLDSRDYPKNGGANEGADDAEGIFAAGMADRPADRPEDGGA